MKYKELTTKPEAELRTMVGELKAKSHELMVKGKLNQLKNHHELGQVKKDIARILTYLHTKISK